MLFLYIINPTEDTIRVIPVNFIIYRDIIYNVLG